MSPSKAGAGNCQLFNGATGFPIAKISANLAVGYLLDELMKNIEREL